MKIVHQDEYLSGISKDPIIDNVSGMIELRDINLSNMSLPMLSFEGTKLVDCTFSGDGLSFDRFLDCDIIGCNFKSLNLNKTTFLGVHFFNCIFENIHSYRVDIHTSILFEKCEFIDFKVEHSFLQGVFKHCHFRNTQFSELKVEDGERSFEIKSRKNGDLFIEEDN